MPQFRLVRVEKRAVNADNFVVASEERIVSITYERELVPVVLMQQCLARRPVISELDIEPCTMRLLARRSFEISNRRMGALLASRVERFWLTDDNFALPHFAHFHPRTGCDSGPRDRLQLRPDEVSIFRCVAFQRAA